MFKKVNIADPYYGRYGGHIKHKGLCGIGGNARDWKGKRAFIKTSAHIIRGMRAY